MKVIDVHAHVFPDDIADEYIADYARHSGMQAACRPTLQTLFEEYKGIDVIKFIVLQEWESSRPFESENLSFAAESDRYYKKSYFYYFNRWLGKIQKEHDSVRCFGGVHPDDPRCTDEFDLMVSKYGLSGLKLVPCMQHFYLNDRRLFPVYEKAESEGIPLLVHTGGDPIPGREMYGHPRDVNEIAAAFPRLVIILAHMGIPFFEETKTILQKHDNVFTDIAFTAVYDDVRDFSRRHAIDAPFLTREFWATTLSSLITEFGHEKILFGSDFPFIKPSAALESLLHLHISDTAKEMILWRNAKELLKL